MYKIFLLFIFILPVSCFGQTNHPDGNLKAGLLKLKVASDSLNKLRPPEKLYIQFDKPYYAVNDTIWFKAYLFKAAFLTPADKSGILNIDIANDSDKVIKKYRLPVKGGLTWGNIGLNDKDFKPGTYTLRAYTNWMRNFGDDYFYYKTFYICGGDENSMLINTNISTSVSNGNTAVNAKLLFRGIDKVPFATQPLALQVINDNRHLYRQKFLTGVDGMLNINFNLPEKAKNPVIIAENDRKDKIVVIPVTLNHPENTDVQFLPEGGSLVAGLPAHIGFKAVGEDGKGCDVTGIVADGSRNQVAEFKSLHQGIGSFYIMPENGETYIAKVTLPGGIIKSYPLPAVKTSGTILQVKNPIESDSVEVIVGATGDIAQSGENYFLIGKARGIVCYAAVVNFRERNYIKRKIAKSLFPSGITHFTLMTTGYRPVNERQVFVDHNDNLNIKLTADKPYYDKRDSVALKLTVTDRDGNPVKGNFSAAVTDNASVKTDSLNNDNILSRLLLAADLKGYIEEPGYYLSSKTQDVSKALDNLLITQGWIGYTWQQVIDPPVLAYQPEREFEVKGNVLNAFNKPLKKTDVLLFSNSPAILMDTATDNAGEFVFDHFPRVDTPIFVLKAVNKNRKSFNVMIKVDEIIPPAFTKPRSPAITPWYINSDSTLLNYTNNNVLAKQQENFPSGGHVLKEVKIKARKIIPGSQNLDGPADIVLDEKDLEKAGKKTFLQVLEENIKGFHESYKTIFTHSPSGNIVFPWYFVGDRLIVVSVDGISLNRVMQSIDFIALKQYLESHSAEDIKGIEVTFVEPNAIIEITTRSGHGPMIDNTPGMYLYKPLALSWPRQFYKPKYTVKDATNKPDLRSTIDWEPNIETNSNGEGELSFYTADKPSTYTVIIQGTDMNGNLGYKTAKITVTNQKEKAK